MNQGVAYGDGEIFLDQADTRLVALDPRTGQVVWTNGDPAPLVVIAVRNRQTARRVVG